MPLFYHIYVNYVPAHSVNYVITLYSDRPYIHIPPPLKRCRLKMLIASLCAFHAEDRLF